MELTSKVLNGLERLSEALKALQWEKAKVHGVSPMQIQLLLFVADHQPELCNVSSLAREFNVTKATISDAVKALITKEFLEKSASSVDRRSYNVATTKTGRKLVADLSQYARPLLTALDEVEGDRLEETFSTLTQLMYQLNRHGVVQVQRTCFRCAH